MGFGRWVVGVAAVLSVAGVTAGPGAQAAPARAAAGPAADQHTLSSPRSKAGLGQLTSRNWAGYVALPQGSTKTFTSVSATWVQPKVTCPTKDAWVVFWVGLDGWLNNSVEQGGSSARCVDGVPQYRTWWETFPTNAIQTVDTIAPGDTITASVTYSPASGRFTIVVKDVTNGKAFTRSVLCGSGATCDRTSAEVIAEDVGRFGTDAYFPLAKYAPTTFTKVLIRNQAKRAGAFASAAWSNNAVTETSDGVTYATVGPLSAGGKRFTATWRHQ